MTVDLSQYLNQEVEVTYENGDTDTGWVTKNPHVDSCSQLHYIFRPSNKNRTFYTKDGFFWSDRIPNYTNIIKIKPIKMKKYEQLENQIKELQAEVERLKKEEEKTKLPKAFSREVAIAFLGVHDSLRLGEAFAWDTSPQGRDYWDEISSSLRNNPSYKVPQEAIMTIQSWVIESYKEQYGV